MIHTIGILSDTHLGRCSDFFRRQVECVFADCSVLLHAGDLTDLSVLDAFHGKQVHAVHGNSCNDESQRTLPVSKLITIGGVQIGLCHGAWGPRQTIEERVLSLFPEADCIVYGHSHRAVCHRVGGVLCLNPGTFQSGGPYGAAGSYAILQIDDRVNKNQAMRASIHEVPR